MVKIWAFTALFLLQAPSVAPLVEDVRVSIVLVQTLKTNCSGFAVGLTRVLTAFHCIDGDELTINGEPAQIVRQDEEFALLEIKEPKLIPLTLAKNFKMGEAALPFGFAMGKGLMVYNRIVAGEEEGMLVMDGPITPGMSGGPVINSKGEVIGLNQATTVDRGFACPVKEIRDFLK